MPQGKPRRLRHANHIERSTPRLFRELSKSPDERFRPERQLPETLPLDDLLRPAMVERSRQPWAVSCCPGKIWRTFQYISGPTAPMPQMPLIRPWTGIRFGGWVLVRQRLAGVRPTTIPTKPGERDPGMVWW